MTNYDKFLWLVMAGLSVQLTSSGSAIRCMALALEVASTGGVANMPIEKLAMAADNFIAWQFKGAKKPEWVRVDESRFKVGL